VEPGYRPLLSVLMPTLVRREPVFCELVKGLCGQAEASAAPVEIVGLQNAGERPLAEYREMLLRDARGEFLCFVDDDDQVAGDYVDQICAALRSEPAPDVVTFVQDGSGTQAGVTLFGLGFLGAPWHPVIVNGVATYLRVYSHMQPIRAEVARQGSFLRPGGLGFTQEDQHFAMSVVPLLLERGSREAHVPRVLYTYNFMSAGDSTQQGRQHGVDGEHERPAIASPCFRWYGALLMDVIGWFMATLHQMLGHVKAAQALGVPPGDPRDCLMCRFEADPTEENKAAVQAALRPSPEWLQR